MLSRVVIKLAIVAVLFPGCKKNDKEPGTLQMNLSYKVDNAALQFDTMAYTCDAGYNYELTKLRYYLSAFVFTRNDGTNYQVDTVFYIDASRPTVNALSLPDFPIADYTAMSFVLGLDSIYNVSGALPGTTDNINMLWPDMMGGGYHFIQLEGHYRDSQGTYGFAMHLGKNRNAVPIHLNRTLTISAGSTTNVNLTMNINEWFRNPNLYDFKADGSYSMTNDSAMTKLCNNGKDIFNGS